MFRNSKRIIINSLIGRLYVLWNSITVVTIIIIIIIIVIIVYLFFSLQRKGHDFSKAAKVMPNKVIIMTNVRDTSLYLYEVATAKIG